MRIVLYILFLILHAGNSVFLTLLYPKMGVDYNQYVEAIKVRDTVMETLIFIILISSFFRNKIKSKSIEAGLSVIVLGNIIDKAVHHNFDRHIHDVVVVSCAVFVSYSLYLYENKGKQ